MRAQVGSLSFLYLWACPWLTSHATRHCIEDGCARVSMDRVHTPSHLSSPAGAGQHGPCNAVTLCHSTAVLSLAHL